MGFFDKTDIENEIKRLTEKVNKIFNLNQRGTLTINDDLDKTNLNVNYNLAPYTVKFTANYATNDEGIRGMVKLVPKIEIPYINFYFDENSLINGLARKFESELIEKLRNRFRKFGISVNYPPTLIKPKSTQSLESDIDESRNDGDHKPDSHLEIKKNKLRGKVEKIYDVFKKFNTTLGRGEVVFKFTVILPPVATVNFKEVGKINDFGLFVYDEDGEIYIDELQPYLIIPKFYIIYDEEMIENLEWSQKPDYMWLESKIKDKIIKNFKNFKIDVSHFGKAVWRTFEKTNLDDTSDLWNPNFKNGLLSESWDDEGHIPDSHYEELEDNPVSDEELNRVKRKGKKIYGVLKTGVVNINAYREIFNFNVKLRYVLPDEPKYFRIQLKRYGKNEFGIIRRYPIPKIVVNRSEIKIYIEEVTIQNGEVLIEPDLFIEKILSRTFTKVGDHYIINDVVQMMKGMYVNDAWEDLWRGMINKFNKFDVDFNVQLT